jgi:hypothetical protein
MKTKTLLLAAATLATTLVTSQAQVYSGVVGYASVTLTNGFNILANQLDYDGTGTNNTVYTCIGTNLPTGSKIYAYDPSVPGYRNITLLANGTWTAGAAGPFVQKEVQPGNGVFVDVISAVPTNITLTLVGQVLQQTNLVTLPSQYQIVSMPFPQAGYLTTNFGYVANAPVGVTDDTVLQWNPATQLFVTHRKLATIWQAGSPNLAVGEAFFLVPNQTTTWTNSLIVQ